MKLIPFLITLVFITTSLPVEAQSNAQNPFHKQNATETTNTIKTFQGSSNPFYTLIAGYQKNFNSKITKLISDYKENEAPTLLIAVLIFAAVYGFMHAMTPGHGKNIISAWILSAHRGLDKLIFTAVTGMFFHVFTAVAMIYIIWFIIRGKISISSPIFIKIFSYAAFLLIIAIAVKNLVQIVKNFFKQKKMAKSLKNLHHSHGLETITEKTTYRSCFIIALSMGLIPCPVSSILIIFLLTKELVWEGLLTGLFFSLGMSLTLLIFSISIWIFRSLIHKVKKERNSYMFDTVFQFFGVLLLVFSALIIIIPYL